MHAQLILILHAFVKKVVPIYQSRDDTEGLKNIMKSEPSFFTYSYLSDKRRSLIIVFKINSTLC